MLRLYDCRNARHPEELRYMSNGDRRQSCRNQEAEDDAARRVALLYEVEWNSISLLCGNLTA